MKKHFFVVLLSIIFLISLLFLLGCEQQGEPYPPWLFDDSPGWLYFYPVHYSEYDSLKILFQGDIYHLPCTIQGQGGKEYEYQILEKKIIIDSLRTETHIYYSEIKKITVIADYTLPVPVYPPSEENN